MDSSAACAAAPGHRFPGVFEGWRQGESHGLRWNKKQLDVPFYAQEENGCGAASVAMVMEYWENYRPELRMAVPAPQLVYEVLYRPEQKGIQLAAMKRYLEGRGFRVFTLHGEWADVGKQLAKGRPIIAGLRAGRNKPVHFVVVTGAGSGRVWLNDPLRRKPSHLEQLEFEGRGASADRWMLLAAPSRRE